MFVGVGGFGMCLYIRRWRASMSVGGCRFVCGCVGIPQMHLRAYMFQACIHSFTYPNPNPNPYTLHHLYNMCTRRCNS